ncbi:sigma-70 family RNA polymerase sigma factor [Pseudomonas putida]
MPSHHQLFTSLFAQHYHWLRSRVSRTLGCPDRADDVTADAFMRLLGLQDLDGIREPRALLSTIAKRLMINNWRRADLEQAYLATLNAEPDNTVPSPEEYAMLLESLVQLDQLLGELSRQAKAVFIHRLFDDMTYEQIGWQLGISRSRVHQHMEQAFLCCLTALSE